MDDLQFSDRSPSDDLATLVLERLGTALFLLDPRAAILFANLAARRMLSRSDVLLRESETLRARDTLSDAKLQRAIREAITLEPGTTRVVTVQRPAISDATYLIHLAPLATAVRPSSTVVATVDAPTSVVSLWQSVFGLTNGEAAVACEVVRGLGLQSVADDLSISLSTVRTHLQRVFQKTGTHRQSELTQLLLRLRPTLMLPSHQEPTGRVRTRSSC